MGPRQLAIRILTPLVWRLSPSRMVAAIQRFGLVERDSGCQLLHCMEVIPDPRLRAYLFQHVLEEFFHGDLFAHLARGLSSLPLYEEILPREELLEKGADASSVRNFFAYVHVGEQAVNRDFLLYGELPVNPKVRAVFRRAGMDEGKHEHDTDEILFELCGRDRVAFRWAIFRAKAKRWWKLYTSAMQAVGLLPLNLLLSGIYFFAGALAVRGAKRRLALSREEQLEIFRAQVKEFEEAHS